MGRRIAIASTGRPTDCKTKSIVTIPALGIPGAPIAASMAVKNTIICCMRLRSTPTKFAMNNAAAASYNAVPSMFTVAPRGRTKPAILRFT